MKFTLRQIQVFDAVVIHGSTLAAAESLQISQPAVSRILAEFEANFGAELFYRWKKRMVLNEIGRSILASVRLILANAKELERHQSTSKSSFLGTLHLGASTTIANYIIPQILVKFAFGQRPVKIEVSCGNKSAIVSRVKDLSLDLGIIAGEIPPYPDITSSSWRMDELCVFASPKHPLTSQATVTLDDLLASTWILREDGSGTREDLLKALNFGLNPERIVIEFDSTEPIKRAVEHSQSLGCISRSALQREVDAGLLTILPTPYLNLTRSYSILIHKMRRNSESLQYFSNFFRAEVQAPPHSVT